MGQPEKSPAERVAVPVRIPSDRVKEYLEYKPTPEAIEKRKARRRRMAAIRIAEDVSRKAEEQTLLAMEAALGSGKSVQPQPENVLADEEEEALLKSIDEVGEEDQDELRKTIMGSINDREVFKTHYREWKERYDNDPKLQAKQTFDEYAKEKGIQYIKQNRKLIIKKRTRDFYGKFADREGLDDAQQKEQRDKLYKVIDLFVQGNRPKLLEYQTMDPNQQKLLFNKFWNVIKQQGFEKTAMANIKELFDLIVGDIEHEVFAIWEFEKGYEELMKMVDLNLSDEEWEARRQKALKKNAQGDLQEYLKQQLMPTYAYVPAVLGTGPSFESIKDVANASGVNLRPAPGKGSDVYYVDFPTIKDSTFMPLMKIVYPPGAKSINDAVFVLEEPWIDKDAKTAEPIEKAPTREFKAADIPRAVNALILDYVLNKGIRVVEPVKGGENINDIIHDTDMSHMAERLFGFKLEEKRILDPQVALFKRFLKVVLRDDLKSSLFDRAKKVRVALDDDSLVPYFREALQSKGAATKTLDDVIEEAKLRREGKVK